MKKYTKIVATISDKRCDVDFIRKLYKAGMNVVRLNTAHLDYEGMSSIITSVREVSQKIAILIDTKGPEIRTTKCEDSISLETGNVVRIIGDPAKETTKDCIYVSYENIVEDVIVGSHILIDDGEIGLIVVDSDKDSLICNVLNNGILGSRKSVNIPGVRINLPSLTARDLDYIKFAISNEIDFIAHSFVRNANDVKEIQKILNENDSPIKIIAKIENQEGVNNINEILENVYEIGRAHV